MTISSSVVKGAGIISGMVGLPTAAVYFHKYATSLYEVEVKVIEGDQIEFDVQKSGNNLTVKVKTNGWEEQANKNYWECQIIGRDGLTIDETDLKIQLEKASGNTKEIRSFLVAACSHNREKKNNQQVKTKLTLPIEAKADNWLSYVVGPDTLNEIEKAALSDDVYLDATDDVPNASTTVKVSATSTNSNWASKNYSWECMISPKSDSFKAEALKKKIFNQSNDSSNPSKKANKKRLLYACAKNRTIITNTEVKSTFTFPSGLTTATEMTYLFGTQ